MFLFEIQGKDIESIVAFNDDINRGDVLKAGYGFMLELKSVEQIEALSSRLSEFAKKLREQGE